MKNKHKILFIIPLIVIMLSSCILPTSESEPYVTPTYYFCMNNLAGDNQVELFETGYQGYPKIYVSNSDHAAYFSDENNVFMVNVETLDTLNITCDANGFAISPDGEIAVFQQDKSFYKYVISSRETSLLLQFYDTEISYPYFSSDGETLIFSTLYQNDSTYTKKIRSYNIDENIMETLHTIEDEYVNWIRMPRYSVNDDNLYFEYISGLYRMNLSEREIFCIYQFNKNMRDYSVSDSENYLLYVNTSHDCYYLTSDGMDLTEIEYGFNYTFLNDQQLLYSRYGIFIYDVYSGNREEIIELTRGVGYLKEREQIVYIRGIR